MVKTFVPDDEDEGPSMRCSRTETLWHDLVKIIRWLYPKRKEYRAERRLMYFRYGKHDTRSKNVWVRRQSRILRTRLPWKFKQTVYLNEVVSTALALTTIVGGGRRALEGAMRLHQNEHVETFIPVNSTAIHACRDRKGLRVCQLHYLNQASANSDCIPNNLVRIE